MSEKFYSHVESRISKKAKFKLANAVAHGDDLQAMEVMVRLKRKNNYIFISVEGEIYKAVKCI